MNNLPYASQDLSALSTDRVSGNISFTSSPKEVAYGLPVNGQPLSEEEKGYRATCEESYDITRQMLALYAMHPDSLYAI